MIRWTAVAGIYGFLGLIAASAAYFLHESPWTHPDPWLELSPWAAHGYSAILGLTFGLVVVVLTRTLVERVRWARTLHAELRPLARDLPPSAVLSLALLSSLGEELLFRSLLQPATNLWIQAAVFGLIHQLPGRARWIWVAWATIMGTALGALFAGTGSLLGPLLAHALINGMNLRFLQTHDVTPQRHSLGGLLGSVHPR